MKRLLAALLILSVIALTGCGDKEAREYAGKLVPVLGDYQQELTQKIKAEQESYQAADQRYARAEQFEITTRLKSERAARSEELADEIATTEDPLTISKIFAALQDYGDHDFKTTQALLGASMEARSRYLTELESLEVEQQKIKLLKESLTELAKARKGSKEFKEAAAFLQKVQTEMAQQACGNSPQQPTALKTAGISEQLLSQLCQ